MNAVTEQEAGWKLCPFAIASVHATRPSAERPAKVSCMASACMAWRWQAATTRELAAGSTERHPAHVDTIKHERGYCGLAGRI